jgi:predicted RNA binding protein YcfA (HicA-like mRNA interferase family)
MNINNLSSSERIQFFRHCYQDITRKKGLLAFIKDVRGPENDYSGKYSVKQTDLDNLFTRGVWSERTTRSGHRKFVHPVTKVVVEYADHNKNIDPGAAKDIMEQIQRHVNFIGNNILYATGKRYNWSQEPDFEKAEKNWTKLESLSSE